MTADVHVQRHLVTCRITGLGSAGESAVRAAVDDGLPSELEDAIGSVGLHGYWLLRRLDAGAQVGSTWSSVQVGVVLARGIAAQVAAVARGGTDPENALWFPDRAAFVTRFLLDLATGRVQGRWEYAQFSDLLGRREPAAALASAEPAVVATALTQLTPAELETVAVALDGDAILAALAEPGTDDLAVVLDAVGPLVTAGRLDVPRAAALVVATTVAREVGTPVGAVAAAARDVADVLALVRGAGPEADALLSAIRDGRWPEVAAHASPETLLALVRWSPTDRTALAEILARPGSPLIEAERVHTPFGGGLLLVPLLDDLCDWPAAARGWPEGDVEAVRLLCVTAALGRGTSMAAAADPVLRAALAVPADLDLMPRLDGLTVAQLERFDGIAAPPDGAEEVALPVVESPASRLVGRVARALVGELGRRLPGMASASPTYLWSNVLDVEAWVRFGEHEVIAELGHAPLSVLLSMTGLDRATFVAGEVRWTLTTRP